LTATGYKFLEVGINVGPPSYVEIVLGDNRGNELILSLETWKGLYEQRRGIEILLRNDYKDDFALISVGPLTARVCTINGLKLVRLESQNVRLLITESTLHRMFDLDQCIDATFDRLCKMAETVDVRYMQLANVAATVADPEMVSSVIRASGVFDKRRIVDCELVAFVFSATS
jgi:hypothetical protein